MILKIIIILILSNLTNVSTKNDCPKGYFKLINMRYCHLHLDCKDWKDLTKQYLIGEGYVKQVFLAEWKNHTIALNVLKNEEFEKDFQHGTEMISSFQPSNLITQFIGSCRDQFLTEYHKFGSADKFHKITKDNMKYDNLGTRLNMCIQFIEAINFLHNSPMGKRVMCDANSLDKMMSQFLITNEFRLVVNDLDALPLADGKRIKCGRRQLFGTFVAPEQLWPFGNKTFNDNDMPAYNEKIDIWKVPDVCQYFLGKEGVVLSFHLFKINKLCKSLLPKKRPNSVQLLQEYKKAGQQFYLMDEL